MCILFLIVVRVGDGSIPADVLRMMIGICVVVSGGYGRIRMVVIVTCVGEVTPLTCARCTVAVGVPVVLHVVDALHHGCGDYANEKEISSTVQ